MVLSASISHASIPGRINDKWFISSGGINRRWEISLVGGAAEIAVRNWSLTTSTGQIAYALAPA